MGDEALKFIDSFLVLAALAALGAMGWWGVYKAPETASAMEAELEAGADAALAEAGIVWARVEMEGQKALITGSAPTEEAKTQAVETVLTSAGPGGYVFGGVTAANTVFSNADVISPFVWRAKKAQDGSIELSGYVPNAAAEEALLSAANAFSGNRADDRTQIGDGAPAGDWIGAAEAGLVGLSRLESGTAILNDTRLSVSGVASSQAIRDEVSALITGLAKPFEGDPEIRGVGLWRAALTPQGLELAGEVATEAEKQEILELASRHFEGEVQDLMRVNPHNHSGWMQGVRFGLPHFAKFRAGDMRFDPEALGYVFNGEATRSTLTYLRDDLQRMTADYPVDIRAAPVDVEIGDAPAAAAGEGLDRAACEAGFARVLDEDKIAFASGGDEISRESADVLDALMAVAQRCNGGLQIEVGGHTDSIGDRAFNLSLSEMRAQAVVSYMAGAGFDAARLTAVGYGPDRPVADNGTAEGREANRRLQFRVSEESE